MNHKVILKPDGDLEFIGDDPLGLPLENVRRVRLSHILPVDPVKRATFRLLRFLFGDEGRVANWTRTWHGPCTCAIVSGGPRFVGATRAICVEWERSVLENI